MIKTILFWIIGIGVAAFLIVGFVMAGRRESEENQRKIQAIYDSGFRAGKVGMSASGNPFTNWNDSHEKRVIWLNGWVDGKETANATGK